MAAILLWVLSLAALMLLAGGWPGRRAPVPSSAAIDIPAAPAAIEAPAPWRASPRPALQTGAAILALALALDVASAPNAWAAPSAIPEAAALTLDEPLLLVQAPQPWIAVEPTADWALKAAHTTDGWLI